MTGRAKQIGVLILAGGLLSGGAFGAVFRTGGNPKGRLNAVGLPWQEAYRTTMTVNGRRNDVVVFSARYDEPVAVQLKAQFELQGAEVHMAVDPQGGAMGTARWEGGEARIVVVGASDLPNQLVYLFYPEQGTPRSVKAPVSGYPRANITEQVVNEDTGTFCSTAITADSVEQVQRYYQEIMAQEGWSPLLSLPLGGGISWFRKGEKSCCILARPQDNGETTVTLLVRDAGF
ncbi:MAG: hypothetical protein JXR25_08755 [Pontiellaceae bacterium]|nr:hypothetical protein [Pontiellaceae bacterium]MBN2784904.1 hypothetical protein [Pontiellaceae bacterium]